ncbi:MAG: sigma-70 family RNA polymerase sigma factor [Actinobacteria bacterium]|nr:sigma-70 family RNA polymerase sigma factor [Actinomycetota bacterium]
MRTPDRHDRLPDDALLTAVALGDTDATAVFVRRFQSRVYGLAITITSDRALSEDIAQSTFERAWRHGATYDSRRASVGTWLLTICRNLAIDAIRVRRPVPVDPWTIGEMLAYDPDAPVVNDPADGAIQSDHVGRLRRALAALPAEQRRAVVLATIGGRTTTEIGLLEGVGVPTAKTRLRNGLLRLRAALESEVER